MTVNIGRTVWWWQWQILGVSSCAPALSPVTVQQWNPIFCTFLTGVTTGSRDQLYQRGHLSQQLLLGWTVWPSCSWDICTDSICYIRFENIYMYVIIAKVFITKLFFCKDKRWEPRTVKGEFGAEAHAGRFSMSFCRKQLSTLNVVRYIFYLMLRVTALKCSSLDFSAFWNVNVTVWCFFFP